MHNSVSAGTRHAAPPRLAVVRKSGPQVTGYTLVDGTYLAVGGVLMGLVNGGRPAVVRLDGAGTPMPGWAAEGNAAMTEVVNPWIVLVAPDGRGGAYASWQDRRGGVFRLYASRLDASGRLAPGWPATAGIVAEGAYPRPIDVVSLAGGAAIALWEDWTPSGYVGRLRDLVPGEPGPIAELGPIDGEVGFGVAQVRPNPTTGPIVAVVELPTGDPARLELIDAAGRMVESIEVDFHQQARGAARLNEAGRLPAGVYWLRLTQGPRRATKKVVVLE